ncbi:hypothetical protein OFN71_33345, partial [Escherichia coli]|nr:hypothetical protein [Escherichia coli]
NHDHRENTEFNSGLGDIAHSIPLINEPRIHGWKTRVLQVRRAYCRVVINGGYIAKNGMYLPKNEPKTQ